MLRITSFVWGTRDVRRSAEFWCAALGYRPRGEIEEDWATLVPATDAAASTDEQSEASGPRLSLMRVNSDRPRRHHLDLAASDPEAEVERLVALGATRVPEWRYEDDADYIVLADPDGSTFCVCAA